MCTLYIVQYTHIFAINSILDKSYFVFSRCVINKNETEKQQHIEYIIEPISPKCVVE